MAEHEEWPDPHYDLLVIELGKMVLTDAFDCYQLFDEIESIAEDFPGNIVVFKI